MTRLAVLAAATVTFAAAGWLPGPVAWVCRVASVAGPDIPATWPTATAAALAAFALVVGVTELRGRR